jgi:hypothetical protein
MDFSELTSLGGGCAKIIREKAENGFFSISIAGASATILKFLNKNDEQADIRYSADVDEALHNFGSGSVEEVTVKPAAQPGPQAEPSSAGPEPAPLEPAEQCGPSGPEVPAGQEDSSLESAEPVPDHRTETPGVICLGLDPDTPEDQPAEPVRAAEVNEAPDSDEDPPTTSQSRGKPSSSRDLKKKLVQYSTLLSISYDFNRITDRLKLVDAFLLTTIAQVGVECAAFFELRDDSFFPLSAKGMELEDCFPILPDDITSEPAKDAISPKATAVADFFIEPDTASRIDGLGFCWVVPVIIYGKLRALVMIGKSIKKTLDDSSFEILEVLVRQAAVAYENSSRFDEESDRTLGLVQTLISLIEENTLARGNTAMIANYSFSLAKNIHYPEERIRDLLFGIVLRDIGMIKVSDLIVRSPRELVKEEWEIIKRHPIDGAEMLRKMKFSEHAIQIVLCHHERFNGEGYPNKMSNNQIPLGARIVSVVESYGAMLQDRPTRPSLTREEALNTLKENWGSRYDSEIVTKFVEIIEEEIRTGECHHLSNNELFTI